jgi:hypothetical protein
MLEPWGRWIVTGLSRSCKEMVSILFAGTDNRRWMRGIVWARERRGWVYHQLAMSELLFTWRE